MLDRVAGQPTWLLAQANARAQRLLHDAFTAAGVRGYHYRLLAALEQYGAVSQAELARHTGIDPKDVVGALNELVEAGAAQRSADPADGRRNLVRITRWGRVTLRRLDAALADVQAELLAPLAPRERETLVALLTRLAAPDPAS